MCHVKCSLTARPRDVGNLVDFQEASFEVIVLRTLCRIVPFTLKKNQRGSRDNNEPLRLREFVYTQHVRLHQRASFPKSVPASSV